MTEIEKELLDIIRNSNNPEQALLMAIELAKSFLDSDETE